MKDRLFRFSIFLALTLALAGCFMNPRELEYDNWDAGDGKVYVRIPLTSDRAVADFSHTFDKDYVDYWEAVFQKTGTPAEYFSASATRGKSYLIAAVTPGTYNVLVLGGVNVTGRPNGEKVLLASGYTANQTILQGQGKEIAVPMSRHTVRVRPYEGAPGGSTAIVFYAEKVGDEQRVFAPGGISDAYLADFIYNAEIAHINALIQAAGSEPALAGHLLNPEIFAYAGGVDTAASLFTSPPPQCSVNAGAIQFYAGIPSSSIAVGEYMTRFNLRYYAFGQPEMTLWNLRRGITAASNDPLGGAVRICFTGPWATGGITQFNKNPDGSFDEIHIFETANNLVSAVSPFEVFHAPDPASVRMLVVAGGGGGGGADSTHASSGGGAGGLLKPDNRALPVGSYTVTVGGGGTSGTAYMKGADGQDSSITGPAGFTGITAEGGGGGGWHRSNSGGGGSSGGSGGGGYNSAGAAVPGQGSAGGVHGAGGRAGGGGFSGAGDGGGAGGAGIDKSAIPAVAGISGLVPDGFAGGGSGGGGPSASHGGGDAALANPALRDGQPHTGGGGAGNIDGNGYAGGSGIAVIRFKLIP